MYKHKGIVGILSLKIYFFAWNLFCLCHLYRQQLRYTYPILFCNGEHLGGGGGEGGSRPQYFGG